MSLIPVKRIRYISDHSATEDGPLAKMDETFWTVWVVGLAAWTVFALIFCGWHLSFDDVNAKPAIRETATLFGISLTAAGALVLGQLETNRPIVPFIVAFVAVSCSTMFGMVFILMAKSTSKAPFKMHAYDWASVWFARAALWTTTGLMVAIVYLASEVRLPGQSFDFEIPLSIGEPTRHRFTDETEGVAVPVTLSRMQFSKGIPPKLFMVITLRDDLSRTWKVVGLDGFVGLSTEQEMDPAPSKFNKKTDPNKSVWYLDGLKSDKAYTFKVFVHSAPTKEKGVQPNPDVLWKAIRNEKGMSIVVQSREK